MTILTAAALGMLLAADSDPEYPLGSLRFPSLTKPAEPVKLTEFSYAFSENGATVQRFEARIRLKAFAFLSGEVFNQRRGIAFTTQRIDLGLTEARGRYVIEGGYRAAKWLVRARAERRPTPASSSDPGWILDTRGALRFNPDFELLLEFLEDTGSEPFLETRPLRRGALGFLYQRGTGVDISANVSASRVRTEAGIETDRQGVNLGAIVYHDHMQVDSAFAYSRSTGRLAASEGFASVALSGELGPYFVGRASTAQRWQPGIKRFENDTRLGITFFGRRHRFFHGGKVGPQVLALTRRAFELGYNERRVYSIDGLSSDSGKGSRYRRCERSWRTIWMISTERRSPIATFPKRDSRSLGEPTKSMACVPGSTGYSSASLGESIGLLSGAKNPSTSLVWNTRKKSSRSCRTFNRWPTRSRPSSR